MTEESQSGFYLKEEFRSEPENGGTELLSVYSNSRRGKSASENESALDSCNGPFGEVVKSSGSYAAENVFRFSTKYTDTETDLVYYGYRFYDTEKGRWLNRDPIAEDGSIMHFEILFALGAVENLFEDYYTVHSYRFGPNDTLNGFDPDGRSWWKQLWAFRKCMKKAREAKKDCIDQIPDCDDVPPHCDDCEEEEEEETEEGSEEETVNCRNVSEAEWIVECQIQRRDQVKACAKIFKELVNACNSAKNKTKPKK